MDMPIPDGFLSVRDKPTMAKAAIGTPIPKDHLSPGKLMTQDELRADYALWERNRFAAEKAALQQPATAPQILDAAAGHMRDRAATYDSPQGERSMGRAVAALNAVLGRQALTESEGWLLLQLLKDVRDRQRVEPHRDSLEDGVAYAALKAEARLQEGGAA